MRYCPNCGAQCPTALRSAQTAALHFRAVRSPAPTTRRTIPGTLARTRTHGIIIRTRMRGTIRTRTAQDIIIRIRESLPEVFLSV